MNDEVKKIIEGLKVQVKPDDKITVMAMNLLSQNAVGDWYSLLYDEYKKNYNWSDEIIVGIMLGTTMSMLLSQAQQKMINKSTMPC